MRGALGCHHPAGSGGPHGLGVLGRSRAGLGCPGGSAGESQSPAPSSLLAAGLRRGRRRYELAAPLVPLPASPRLQPPLISAGYLGRAKRGAMPCPELTAAVCAGAGGCGIPAVVPAPGTWHPLLQLPSSHCPSPLGGHRGNGASSGLPLLGAAVGSRRSAVARGKPSLGVRLPKALQEAGIGGGPAALSWSGAALCQKAAAAASCTLLGAAPALPGGSALLPPSSPCLGTSVPGSAVETAAPMGHLGPAWHRRPSPAAGAVGAGGAEGGLRRGQR